MIIKRVHAHLYQANDLVKLDLALDLFSFAINSVSFRQLMLKHKPFIVHKKLSNLQIYNLIMSGNELTNADGADEEADLKLSLDLNFSTDVIGHTTKDGWIYTHENLFHHLPNATLAGHYAHEYCHTLGFRDPQKPKHRPFNVPYEVGRLVRVICEQHHKVILAPSADVIPVRNATVIAGTPAMRTPG